MNKLWTVLILTIAFSCNGQKWRDVDPSTGVGYVKSINDTVVYSINPITKKVEMVTNFKYVRSDYYITKISNDTLELGETFLGQIIFTKEKGIIKIESPTDTTFSAGEYVFEYTPTTLRVNEFKGTVNVSSKEFPFLYKFITVEKGKRTSKYTFVGKLKTNH